MALPRRGVAHAAAVDGSSGKLKLSSSPQAASLQMVWESGFVCVCCMGGGGGGVALGKQKTAPKTIDSLIPFPGAQTKLR